MFLLSFSSEACEYFLGCVLEDLGCCVNSKHEALVSSESDVCAGSGNIAALCCQLRLVVSRRKV